MSNYIYKPKGKAGEYGDYAYNIYNGCTHGCKYCYVPAIRRTTHEQYHSSAQQRNIKITDLLQEIKEHGGNELFLCFTCDPYQPIDEKLKLTRLIIKNCHQNNVKVNVLTKGGKRSERDFDLMSENPKLSNYGATLTFLSAIDSLEWEPNAALPEERINALKKAHAMGITTWASLEPVIDPEQSLEIIRITADFVDKFKVGKWNHDQRAEQINWKQFAKEAVNLLEKLGKNYYIKKDLAIYL
jgi:DNA repair photolyase